MSNCGRRFRPKVVQLPATLRNLPVVVVYLYQVQTIGVWKPGDTMGPGGPYLPLRCGRLINAFKDGGIAHFFFELTGYVKPKYRRRSTRIALNEKIKFHAPGARKRRSAMPICLQTSGSKLKGPAIRSVSKYR